VAKAKKAKKKAKKTTVGTDRVRELIEPDPLAEIGSQVTEFINRILELRTLAPVLADAKRIVNDTESRIRVLRLEQTDLLNGLLVDLPPEEVRQGPPVQQTPEFGPESSPEFSPDAFPDDEPVDEFSSALRNVDWLGAKTVASCNQAGITTVRKIVEWYASGTPFSSITGIGPAEDAELRRLVGPYRSKVPQIRAALGM